MTVPVPPWWGVALAGLLMAVAGVVVVRERLGLGRDVVEAAVRAVVQLVAVGFVLRLLFERAGIPGSLGWVAAMVLLGGRTAGARADGLPGAVRAATIGIGIATAATLGLLVEARLALGLPGKAAFAPHRRLALRAALAPGIDQTKVVGLIALPGTMTGLIIAGVSPLTAIRYQIVVQYMWLGSVAIAGLVAARVAGGSLFDEAHRLRPLRDTTPRTRSKRRSRG